jgi:pentatricopeptide repeat protein
MIMGYLSSLLKRFLESQKTNTPQYFDVDEIVSLIHYFLDVDDLVNLNSVVELGYRLHPDDISFKTALCQTLIAIEDYNSALKLLDNIGNIRSKSLHLMRIECYCELDRYDDAISLIDKLTAKKSPYLEDVMVQAISIMNDRDNRRPETYALIKRALRILPDSLPLKTELCFNLELQGKTKEALALCHELIDEDPYATDLWYMQGRLYSLCADFERAIEALDYALTCITAFKDFDMEYEIKLMKAYCLYKNESYDKAIAVYEDLAMYEEFTGAEVDPFLAECYMSLEQYEDAYRILRRIAGHEDLEDEVAVYGNLIYCCIETGRREEAIDILSEMLKNYPGGILEYLSALSTAKDDEPADGDDAFADENNTAGDLARTYLNSNLHNN